MCNAYPAINVSVTNQNRGVQRGLAFSGAISPILSAPPVTPALGAPPNFDVLHLIFLAPQLK